jgi:hypothetical protein
MNIDQADGVRGVRIDEEAVARLDREDVGARLGGDDLDAFLALAAELRLELGDRRAIGIDRLDHDVDAALFDEDARALAGPQRQLIALDLAAIEMAVDDPIGIERDRTLTRLLQTRRDQAGGHRDRQQRHMHDTR